VSNHNAGAMAASAHTVPIDKSTAGITHHQGNGWIGASTFSRGILIPNGLSVLISFSRSEYGQPGLFSDLRPGFGPCEDGVTCSTAEAILVVWRAGGEFAIERDPGLACLDDGCPCAQRDLAFSCPAGHVNHKRWLEVGLG
jgi:hypothetical protein